MDAKLETESLQLLKESARKIYDAIPNPLWCKALSTHVFFNSKGFHHILYNGRGHKRFPKIQRKRLKLLPSILSTITNASEIKSHRVISDKRIEYWALESEGDKGHLRVVLKRTGKGKMIFWSIMEILRDK